MYLCYHTHIPVPAIHGYRVDDWQTDYILMDFVEGQNLRVLWFDLSREEQISYVKQIAGIYAELDHTPFTAIGSLRLGGIVGPLDTLDTITVPDGHLIGVTFGPYESLRAFWRDQFNHCTNQLASDPLLASNADLCHDLRHWEDEWIEQAPDSDTYSLFGLECMKMEDIIIRDGRIGAVIDLENFQINVPEFLNLHSLLQLDEKLDEIFAEECKNRGVRAWVKK